MYNDPDCPLCGRASEFVYKVDQIPCVIKEMKIETLKMIKVLDKKIDKVDEQAIERDRVTSDDIRKLMLTSIMVLATAILAAGVALIPIIINKF